MQVSGNNLFAGEHMEFSSILGNSQKLDGGAMFGNAPKELWSRWTRPDELNRIDLACRALLVEVGGRKLLFEAGIGAYMEPKYRDRYGVQDSEHVLLNSLVKLGISHEDITDIILSHLHFDHSGGLLSVWREGKETELLFPNARYYAGKDAWSRAVNPHYRDRTSFVPALNERLETSGRLVKLDGSEVLSFGGLTVRFIKSDGHTPGMMCSDLRWDNGRLLVAADLIPGRFWVHLPITMGYDRYPEQLINEKKTLLASIVKDNAWVFYTHDSEFALSKVSFDEKKNKFVAVETIADLERTVL